MFIGIAADAGWSFSIRRSGIVEIVELRPRLATSMFRIRYQHVSPTAVAFGAGLKFNDAGRQVATYTSPRAARDALERMTQRLR